MACGHPRSSAAGAAEAFATKPSSANLDASDAISRGLELWPKRMRKR